LLHFQIASALVECHFVELNNLLMQTFIPRKEQMLAELLREVGVPAESFDHVLWVNLDKEVDDVKQLSEHEIIQVFVLKSAMLHL
jgi:hypothetical protein